MKNEIVTGSGDMLFSQHKVSLGGALVGRQVMTGWSRAEHRCLRWFTVSPSVILVRLLIQEDSPVLRTTHSFLHPLIQRIAFILSTQITVTSFCLSPQSTEGPRAVILNNGYHHLGRES